MKFNYINFFLSLLLLCLFAVSYGIIFGYNAIYLLIYFGFSLIIAYIIASKKPTFSSELKNKLGKLTGESNSDENYTKTTFIQAINKIERRIESISSLIDAIDNNDASYDSITINTDDQLQNSLINMKERLVQIAKEDAKTNWTREGAVKFAVIQRDNSDNINNLANEAIQELTKYTQSNLGGFYVMNQEGILSLEGASAQALDVTSQKRFKIGEGLVGQCFKDALTMHIKEVPQTYAKVASGLGESLPKELLLVPMKTQDRTIGVIELASLFSIEDYQVSFVEKLAESLAISILNVKTASVTNELLKQSQEQNELLQSQEEELRRNSEEIRLTQEKVEEKLKETEGFLKSERIKINSIINTSSEGIILVSESGIMTEYNPAFQKMFGYDSSELLKLSLKEVFSLEKDFIEFLEESLSKEIELEVKNKEGHTVWTKISINKIEIEGAMSYSMFIGDITELKESTLMMNDSMNEFQNILGEQTKAQELLKQELEEAQKELKKMKKK